MGNNGKYNPNKKPVKGLSLDTLAQLGTKPKKKHKEGCSCTNPDDDIKLNKSTNVDDRKPLQNRANRKYRAVSLALNLVDVAKWKRDNATTDNFKEFNDNQSRVKSYWNMYHCADKLEHNNGKVTGRYCKNRLCLVCNSIRQAQLINSYSPIIKSWGDDVYFVTLTIENVKGNVLEACIHEMQSIVKKVQGRIKKQLQRADKNPMQGIRKLEGTFNPRRVDFHPHYHLVIKGKELAELFRKYWVELVGKSELINCKLQGKSKTGEIVFLQDIRKADANAPKELFKYFTKIVSTSGKEKHIFCDSLDTIFKAIKGVRTFQSFGFKLPKEEKLKDFELPLELEAEYKGEEEEAYLWIQSQADWVSNVTGAFLSENKVNKKLRDFSKMMIISKNRE